MKKLPAAQPVTALIAWFQSHHRILPWRSEPTPYRVWISEIMLQQTQVKTVVPYFDRFLEAFPDVEALASANEASVMKQWAGLGYYSRARNLHRAARMISAARDFPSDRAGWEALPGVGPYTAGAILSIAYDKPEAILDGNVERVLSRVTLVPEKKNLWRFSAEWVETAARLGRSPSALNQGLMELGALVCTPKKPACMLCPIKATCRALEEGKIEEFPVKKKRAKTIPVNESCAWLWDARRRRVWLTQSVRWRKGLWDVPSAEDVQRALSKARMLGEVRIKTVVTHHQITRETKVFEVSALESTLKGKWVTLEQLHAREVPIGSALKKTLLAIQKQRLI